MPFFQADRLSVRFGGVRALSEVSFDLVRGGVHGLIGPNGAGKTSLINAISGLVPVSSGRLLLDGVELQRLAPHRVARAGVGRAFQHGELFEHETVRANLFAGYVGRRLRGWIGPMLRLPAVRRLEREGARAVDAMIDRFGLAAVAERTAGELPFGLLKKADMARALLGDPKLLLLDEPTSGMGEGEAEDLIAVCLSVVRERGITLLLIEHNLPIVMRLADRVIVLDHGVTIAQGPPDAVQADPAVIAAYLGTEADHA